MVLPVELLDAVRRRFEVPTGMVNAGAPGYSTTIQTRHDPDQCSYYLVEHDGVPIRSLPGEAISQYIEWLLHSIAIARLGRRFLLLHAGAVAIGRSGVVLCAGSGSGKSTLTAGLVAAGFQYLSDEVAAIDPTTLLIHPYPRNICIKEGSRQVLSESYPYLALESPQCRGDGVAVWTLSLPAQDWSDAPVPVRYLIFPRYSPGATTGLEPLPSLSAVEKMANQSFSGNALGSHSPATLVRLVESAECFALTVGTLQQAIDEVSELVRTGERRHTSDSTVSSQSRHAPFIDGS